MTSAAYGIGHHSIADGTAVGCPVSPFFASTAGLGVLLGEERAHPARPDSAFWAPLIVYVGVGCFGCCRGRGPGPGLLTLSRSTDPVPIDSQRLMDPDRER